MLHRQRKDKYRNYANTVLKRQMTALYSVCVDSSFVVASERPCNVIFAHSFARKVRGIVLPDLKMKGSIPLFPLLRRLCSWRNTEVAHNECIADY